MTPKIILVCVGCCLGLIATAAQAQSYPSKPIKVIVPVAPGGATDMTARLVGQKMAERFGQAVVIENRPRANETIGVDAVAKSAPDGYTILLTAPAAGVKGATPQKVPHQGEKEFGPRLLGGGGAPRVGRACPPPGG